MLVTIANILTGGLLDKVLDFFAGRDQARIEAMSDIRRQQHELNLNAAEGQREARRNAKEIRLATANHWEMRLMTFLIAFPFVFHLWSVWFDTQFKMGWEIDKFPEPFDEWQGAIVLSFFGLVGAVGSARVFAGAIAYRKAR